VSFDRLAPHYTWMERVLAGPRLQRARIAWLEALAPREHVLIAGVGHGHFLATAAKRFPHLRFTCVDASGGMLAEAGRRARRHGIADRVEFVPGALPAWQPPRATFDAIATNFFLDCFAAPELALVVNALAESARADATWLLADFTVPARGLGRQRARAVHALMYAFFRRATKISARRVTPPEPFLRAAGFALVARKSFEWGLLHADRWERQGAA
jgi:SAM-dependent methyltransferase